MTRSPELQAALDKKNAIKLRMKRFNGKNNPLKQQYRAAVKQAVSLYQAERDVASALHTLEVRRVEIEPFEYLGPDVEPFDLTSEDNTPEPIQVIDFVGDESWRGLPDNLYYNISSQNDL